MIVFSRRQNQRIIIGEPASPIAVVEVVRIGGEVVRIGVEAERAISVNRQEVADRILAQREIDDEDDR